MRGPMFRLGLLLLAAAIGHAQPAALSVNTASREEVRQFFRAVYYASENAPMGWTGSYASGDAGDVAGGFREATRLRINFYRALAGVPADVTFSAAYNTRAQHAALLMSANDALSHTPPSSWMLYHPLAAEGALNSNLALGHAGPDAINGYMADAGASNAAVGHRRWLLYPQTLQMGSGDVSGSSSGHAPLAANAVWVIDATPGGQFGAPRPATRTTAVPYPPAGFVPYQVVWPRWSFSHPGADFSAATVTMARDGQAIATALEPPAASALGEPTLVWAYESRDTESIAAHDRPAADRVYSVNVSNVQIGGARQNFSYQVTVFDPETRGADAVLVSVSGPALPTLGTPHRYAVARPAFTRAFEWRTVQLTPIARTFTAEAGFEELLATTSAGYEVLQGSIVATGRRAYRLAHGIPRADQVLQVPGTYVVSEGGAIAFRSRLAIATETETARVQVSTDDGVSWIDVFAQSGASPANTGYPPSTETAFVDRTLPLADYVGRSINVRLVYSIGYGTAFVPAPDNAVGWFIDDLTLVNVQALVAGPATRVGDDTSFAFFPTVAGALGLQARGVLFGAYPMEWGPILPVNAVSGTVALAPSSLSNLSVRTTAGTGAETLIVGFSIRGGSKALLVRSSGPALSSFGVARPLSDPRLALYREDAQIAENDDWLPADSPIFKGVGAFGLPDGSRDSALVVSLPPASYTAQVHGANDGTGVALVELYDTAPTPSSAQLSNVSARSQVSADNVLIAGFNLSGDGPRTLLIRGVGPGLADFGIDGALADPKLELFGSNGKIQENDNWDAAARGAFAAVGAFDLPSGSRDAALLVTLPPGSYTAQVSGIAGASGVALVEVYDVP